MKEYKYSNGEVFQVDYADECEIKVTDGKNILSITLNTEGASTYRVSTVKGGWWWYTNTVEESVNRACRELIDSRSATSSDEACRAMQDFVDQLPNS